MGKQSETQEISNPPASLLLETLESRWRNYRGQFKRCRAEPSEEAVHDLRVAARRMLALIDLFRAFAPHPRIQKLRRILKDQLDDFDDLRDTQVALVEVTETLPELPELAPFQELLKKREKSFLRLMAKRIKAFKMATVKKRMDFVYQTLMAQAGSQTLGHLLFQTVDDSYDEVIRRYKRIDPAQPATIHQTRVAFKKFRYMVEIIHPLIPGYPNENLKHMHGFQGAMGDIQDLQVFLTLFDNFAERYTPYDPEPVRRYYQRRFAEAVTAFVEDMHQVNTFWRSAPEDSFPWEGSARMTILAKPDREQPEQEV
jgi:CHAD domain-containing protein